MVCPSCIVVAPSYVVGPPVSSPQALVSRALRNPLVSRLVKDIRDRPIGLAEADLIITISHPHGRRIGIIKVSGLHGRLDRQRGRCYPHYKHQQRSDEPGSVSHFLPLLLRIQYATISINRTRPGGHVLRSDISRNARAFWTWANHSPRAGRLCGGILTVGFASLSTARVVTSLSMAESCTL